MYIADLYHSIKLEITHLPADFPIWPAGPLAGSSGVYKFYMSNHLKIRSPWSQLALFMGVWGLSLIGGVIAASAIVLAKAGISAGAAIDMNDPRLLPAKKLAQAFSTIVIFGLPALLYSRKTFRTHPLENLGFRPAEKSIFYILGVVLLLAALPLEGWLGMLNKQIPLPGWMIRMEKDTNQQVIAFLQIHHSYDIVINVFVIAVLPAIFEELCFRGAFQRILIDIFKSPWTGIVVASAFFSAFHMEFQGFLPRMMLGILLGAAFWYSGSLWTSILGHFFFNGIQVIAASYYPKMINDNPSVPVYVGLLSLVTISALLFVMRRQSTATFDKVYNPADNYDDLFSNQS